MSRIIPRLDEVTIEKTAKRCKARGIRIPTFAELRDPARIPAAVKEKLPQVGLWDVDPANLYRITWKNDPKSGLYGGVNHFELPSALTGVRARVVGLAGKFFPTGAHKVGAAFGCLVPRLVSGAFDPTVHKAVWPSTGNFCRGGAFDCALLDCTAIAILPEEMSQERFEWLREIGAEVIATPGCESNVKEIYDKCWELKGDPRNVIFNQFEELGNPIFHYGVTGPAIEEVFREIAGPRARLAAFVSATGSAGTIGAGDYVKKRHGGARIVASEALQCPTLTRNGFGGHRIEGIGDKHVPWVHNARNTDAVAAIDDADCIRVMQLFNTDAGREELVRAGVDAATVEKLPLLGISGISNTLSAIKAAKFFELDEDDVVFTVFTDSMELYGSRLREAEAAEGPYTARRAAGDLQRALLGQGTDNFKELGYWDRKAIHNLKYFTWIEQQGRALAELNAQWSPEYWRAMFEDELPEFERLIEAFNARIDAA
jgi:cysteine synthase